jgi:hypothetical protein
VVSAGALLPDFGWRSIAREASRLESRKSKMSDQTKDCEDCFATGNEARMRSVQPGRKILFHPRPACGGAGKVPIKSPPSE